MSETDQIWANADLQISNQIHCWELEEQTEETE